MGLFGGGNSSSSNTSNAYDQRQINTVTTDSYDLSNRSVNNTNSYSSTNISTTDDGAIAGALGLAGSALQAGVSAVQTGTAQLGNVLGFASQVVAGQNAAQADGYQFADHLFSSALDSVQSGQSAAMDAYARAAQLENTAFSQASQVQSSALDQLQSAYADAKGTSAAQQKIILAVLAVAALAMLARK